MRLRTWLLASCLAFASTLTQVAASPTPTPTPLATPTPTASATPSPVPTPTSSAQPNPSPSATPSPSPCPSPGSGTPPPVCDPSALLDKIRKKLGVGMAQLRVAQTDLAGTLHANVAEQHVLSGRIAAADDKIAALDAEVERLQREIDATNIRIEQERTQMAALARTIYAQPDSLLLVLAQAHSLNDALSRSSQLLLAGKRAQAIKVQLAEDVKRMQTDQNKAQADRDEQAQQRQELQSVSDDLQILQGDALRIGYELRSKMDEIQVELAILGTQSPDVADELQAQLLADTMSIIADARQATSDHIKLLLRVQARSPGADVSWLGKGAAMLVGTQSSQFTWPLANAVLTQGFGPSSFALEPAYGPYRHFHTGIDLAAPVNSPVVAAADGVVSLVGRDPWGYGNYVVITHAGGLATLYGHLNAVEVAVNQQVTRAQEIGLEGSTGLSTGPHLHFEVRSDGTPTDPIPYMPPLSA